MIGTTNSLAPPLLTGRRARLRCWQWAQALIQARLNGRYELSVAGRKQALFAGIHGDVLEIGPGTGVNLVYLPVGIRWIGVEPNTFMHEAPASNASSAVTAPVHNESPRREGCDSNGAAAGTSSRTVPPTGCTGATKRYPRPDRVSTKRG